jgi:hypothetical protein
MMVTVCPLRCACLIQVSDFRNMFSSYGGHSSLKEGKEVKLLGVFFLETL